MTAHKPELTVYASAARTASPTAPVLDSLGAHGVHVVIDVSAVVATPSVTPSIEGYDALSDSWYTLLTGVAITGTGTTVLKLYPGITAVTNAAASDCLPNLFRVSVAHADADSITYSVSAHLLG